MRRMAAAVVLCMTAGGTAWAAPVEGTFSSGGVQLEIAGGMAFTSTSSLDRQTPVILVAVSNSGLNVDALSEFVDRRRALEQRVRDERTGIVYLEFTPLGAWRGLSYTFAPGNGCGYCTSEVTSTVTLVNGHLVGTIDGREASRPFHVQMDIAVLGDDHGAPLPSDGGEPGRAYLAYHAALQKKDADALRPTLSPGNLDVYAMANRRHDLAGFLAFLSDRHPMDGVTIGRAWAGDRTASLLIEGNGPAGKISGEVLLVKVDGVWTVDDELVDVEPRP